MRRPTPLSDVTRFWLLRQKLTQADIKTIAVGQAVRRVTRRFDLFDS